jgi:tetratricopeptide (TPR) repeat protein
MMDDSAGRPTTPTRSQTYECSHIMSDLSATIARVVGIGVVIAVAGCGSGGDAGDDPTSDPAPQAAAAVGAAVGAAVQPRTTTVLRPELAEFYRLIEQRRSGPARVRLRKHLNLNPNDGQAEFLFGLSYHREKRYALARPYLESAMRNEPGYALTPYFAGWGLYYLGEPDAARSMFERHLEHQPDEGDSHFALGLIALDEDDLDDADRRFRRALELHGDLPGREKDRSKAHALLGDVAIRRGEWERAREELLIATESYRDPDHYAAYYKLYRVLLRLGDADAAEAAQAKFLQTRQRLYPRTSFPE